MAEWWVFAHGREMGPVSTERLTDFARTQSVAGVCVWRKGLKDWQPLGDVAELQPDRSAAEMIIAADARGVSRGPSRWRCRMAWSIAGVLICLGIGLALFAPRSEVWEQSVEALKKAGLIKSGANPKQSADLGLAANASRESVANAIAEVVPIFRSLKEKFPQRFDAIIDEYYGGVTSGRSEPEVLETVRGELLTFVQSLIPQADDDVLVDYSRLMVDQMAAFNAKNPTHCYRYASGTDYSVAVFGELPPPIRQRAGELQVRIVQTARPRVALREDDVQPILEGVRTRLAESKVDMDVLAAEKVDEKRHGEYCEVTIRFFSEIGRLAERDVAVVMRYILTTK